jgi:hypothetical protein
MSTSVLQEIQRLQSFHDEAQSKQRAILSSHAQVKEQLAGLKRTHADLQAEHEGVIRFVALSSSSSPLF